ncbi:hypothetical protein TUM4438_45530 [Shewanella sairae]|uniref:Uncharacterized protein n=1 Tax=Shewanella sairae TaxID=190310 RepID=A0ABQ4PS86_9GAMM|nr:hypothetical protein TUM4438_45530 [Shewanella sairae]
MLYGHGTIQDTVSKFKSLSLLLRCCLTGRGEIVLNNSDSENKPFKSPLTEWILKNKQDKKKQRAELGYIHGQLRIERQRKRELLDEADK